MSDEISSKVRPVEYAMSLLADSPTLRQPSAATAGAFITAPNSHALR